MGETLGKYELVKKIARGGMADVFLARQTGEIGGFSKFVAIKRLFPHLTEEQETIDMFLDEGRIAASLTHPNVTQIYELGVDGDFLYIAMEYVHGRDLRSVLERGFEDDNFIPIELAASMATQVAAGLHFAHTQSDESGNPMNIVHRDISPQNILISLDGAVKVCDFGIAKAEHRLSHTTDGQVKGKFSYMSPEQIESNEVDARSDVFALGIVLYETTTMTRLFKADNQYKALEKILYAGIETPTSLRPGYPADLEQIVMKALERDPASRYQTAEEMQEALDNWLVQNQASSSPVALARYMRGLFSDMPKSAAELVPDEPDEPAAPAPEPEPEPKKAVVKKDVTEMDEDDLDAALDFALGAPSEADVVVSRPVSEASEAEVEPEPEPPAEPEPATPTAGVDYSGGDATVITDISQELASDRDEAAEEPEPAPAAEPEPEPEPAPSPSVIVPTVTKEPEIGGLKPRAEEPAPAPKPEPAAAPEPAATGPRPSPPPGGAPPSTRSQNIPTGPPAAKPPPAATTAEQRARDAFEPDSEPNYAADVSLDDIGDAPIKSNKTGIIVGIIGVLAIGAIAVFALTMDGTGKEVGDELERTQIDPDMLVVEVAEKRERVNANITLTPAEASVIVNGLPVEVSGGQIPLIKGEQNEISVFAKGFAPQRVVTAGEAGDISVTLQEMAEVPQDEVASLEIMSEPRDATIWLDGEEIGKTPKTVEGLWTGAEHHVYIEKDGSQPYSGYIGLVKASQNLIEAKLLKPERDTYVELTIKPVPRGTTLQFEGESEKMSTPFFKPIDRNTFISVSLEEADSAPMTRYLALEDVGTMELRPFLTPMKRERGFVSFTVEPMGPELYVGANAYGQGPTKKLEYPEGKITVVLDTAHGRKEVAVDVLPNAETKYVLRHSEGNVTVERK